MIGASTNCTKNYDGTLFTFTRMDRTQFDSVVEEIDWKALKAIFHSLVVVKGGCSLLLSYVADLLRGFRLAESRKNSEL